MLTPAHHSPPLRPIFSKQIPKQTEDPKQTEGSSSAQSGLSARTKQYNEPDFLAACRAGDLEWAKEQLRKNASLAHQEFQSGKTLDTATPLFIACQENHGDIIKLLFDYGVDVNTTVAPKGHTPLTIAITANSTEAVRLLLQHRDIDINAPTKNGITPLFVAAMAGRREAAVQLLQCPEIDVNAAEYSNKFTPLYMAANRGFTDVVGLLASDPRVDINSDRTDSVPLNTACFNDRREVAVELLKQPAINVNVQDSRGVSPLVVACQEGHSEIVELLLAQPGINVNIRSMDNNTPLQVACKKGHTAVVAQLLAMPDIDIDAQNDDGCTAYGLASRYGHREIMIRLARARGDVNDESDTQLAFRYAVRSGNLPWLRDVLQMKPELAHKKFPFYKKTEELYPLHVVVKKKKTEMLQLLLDKGVDINAVGQFGVTALMMAAEQGRSDVIEMLLLQPGINIDAARGDGCCAIGLANWNGHYNDVIRLARARGDVANESDTQIAVRYAVRGGNVQWLKDLLNMTPALVHQRFPFYKKSKDLFPMRVAVRENHKDIVQLLLDKGAPVNAFDDGYTELMRAAEKGSDEVTGILLGHPEVEVNATSKNGVTALYMAAQNGHTDIVVTLLEHGADPTLKRDMGLGLKRSPLKVARMYNHSAVVALLKAAEQKYQKITEKTPLMSSVSD